MRNFENEAFELSEDERAAMMLTLNECLDYATDAQLQAIHSYALEIAPLPHCDTVDKERVNALHKNVSDIIISVAHPCNGICGRLQGTGYLPERGAYGAGSSG